MERARGFRSPEQVISHTWARLSAACRAGRRGLTIAGHSARAHSDAACAAVSAAATVAGHSASARGSTACERGRGCVSREGSWLQVHLAAAKA